MTISLFTVELFNSVYWLTTTMPHIINQVWKSSHPQIWRHICNKNFPCTKDQCEILPMYSFENFCRSLKKLSPCLFNIFSWLAITTAYSGVPIIQCIQITALWSYFYKLLLNIFVNWIFNRNLIKLQVYDKTILENRTEVLH